MTEPEMLAEIERLNQEIDMLETEAGFFDDDLVAQREKATKLIKLARDAHLEEHDPKDGTDCVTPYDDWFYGTP